MIKYLFSVTISILLIAKVSSVSGQTKIDTLKFSIVEAEKIFLQSNLPLLAEKLNINQADARILQAKAWPNPNLIVDEIQTYVNSTSDDIPPIFGNFWRNRNFAVQVEQLILTAGKRKKNINLEVKNKEFAEIMFTDMLQALKAEFRQTIFEIQYIQRIENSWQIQLQEIRKLLNAQQTQFKEGHISEVEVFRLKALEIALKGEINALKEEMSSKQKAIKNLMFIEPQTYVIINDELTAESLAQFKNNTLNELIDLSENNSLLRASKSRIDISEATLAIELANKTPNINLISNYDRNGSTMRNFVGLGISMELPVFNKNKGNIQAAKYEVEKNMLLQKSAKAQVNNTIVKHWNDLNQAISLYESIDKNFVGKLDDMTRAISKNFLEHNINLLQFLDYYESFRQSKEQYYNSIKNILLKKEDLNYLIGGEI
ncbi:TolC family protein [Emticicia soli]|uniref:TolC family protein n=1 Tax=Emticicia soli TaxID=2027878 RepID=A0ABW5J448_9BACT